MANKIVYVSIHQQTINWTQVKQAGIVGAIIRSGYGFVTVDNQSHTNATGRQNNGLANNVIDPCPILKLPTTFGGQNNTMYTIKFGDTLWDIAQSQLGNGSRYKEIMELNGLSNDVIYPGQVLHLPTAGSSSSGVKTYTVQHVDTLWTIAQSQLGSGSRYHEIVALNQLYGSIIYPGQVLIIPA